METSEVAAMLSMSTSWVYREASKPGLKGYKLGRGKNAKKKGGGEAGWEQWLAGQGTCPSYGECQVVACAELATSPLRLCGAHERRYRKDSKPGGATLPSAWWNAFEKVGRPVVVEYADRLAFRAWCRRQPPVERIGRINLRGLRPLLRAEFQWGLHAHRTQSAAVWCLPQLQTIAAHCRERQAGCLAEVDHGQLKDEYRRIVAASIRSRTTRRTRSHANRSPPNGTSR